MKIKILQKAFIISFYILSNIIYADVLSTTDQIKFDVDSDGSNEMVLSGGNLGIGLDNPSANLHVEGNAIISGDIAIGTTTANANLYIQGSMSLSSISISDNTTISNHSIVFVDTSSGNINLQLPNAEDVLGRKIKIKKINHNNRLLIQGGGNIDSYTDILFETNGTGTSPYIELLATDVHKWSILNISGADNLISSDNLLAWWKFDETSGTTIEDSSGKGWTLTAQNGIDPSSDTTTGAINNGMDFNAGTERFSTASTSEISSRKISISFWLKRNESWDDNVAMYLYFAKTAYNTDGYLVQIYDIGAVASPLRLFTDGATINYTIADPDTFYTLNQWHHIVATFDSDSNACTIYKDGVSQTVLQSSSPDEITSVNVVNYVRNGGGSVKSVSLDDMRIYNKVLSAEEIQTLYSLKQ